MFFNALKFTLQQGLTSIVTSFALTKDELKTVEQSFSKRLSGKIEGVPPPM
jgi:hypothetical protein